jgi:uncharacterized protein YfdQ (DUF2303 family)
MPDKERITVNADSIIDAAARHLPTTTLLHTTEINGDYTELIFSVPKDHRIERADLEKLAPSPRRIRANASAHDLASFVHYVRRFANETSLVWVNLNPETNALALRAQLDDNSRFGPSWREHSVTFSPSLSVEWRRWNNADAKAMAQVEFATFIEDNLVDITSKEGLPSGADMLKMALEFEARQDQRLKSHARLMNGGIQLEYISDDDAATVTRMQLFDRFQIGIPVFWGGDRWSLDARLRYRAREGKVSFWFELIRPDRVHEAAARALIQQLRDQVDTDEAPQRVSVIFGQL